jgi:hypothetical protein
MNTSFISATGFNVIIPSHLNKDGLNDHHQYYCFIKPRAEIKRVSSLSMMGFWL